MPVDDRLGDGAIDTRSFIKGCLFTTLGLGVDRVSLIDKSYFLASLASECLLNGTAVMAGGQLRLSTPELAIGSNLSQ